MKAKKIILSAFLIMAIAITVATPILARSNIILIQDSYHYLYECNCSGVCECSEECVFIVSECGTNAGEAQQHKAVSEAISAVYGTTIGKDSDYRAFSSYATAKQYIGDHSDDYNNYYEVK